MKKVIEPCAHCGKPRGDHNARTMGCPFGRKHRVFGYSNFGPTVFEPKSELMTLLRRSPLRPKRPTPRRKGKPAPRIKPKREEDLEHLDRLREFGCWCCRVDGLGLVAAEPHHPRAGGKDGPGAGQRAPDRDALPLCRRHHNEQHPDSLSIHRNPIEFRERYGTEAEIRDKVAEKMAQTLETLYNGTED